MKSFWTLVLGCIVSSVTLSARDWNASVAKFKDNKDCAISYTFDDGLAEHYSLVAPELEKRGFRGTFWIVGSRMNQDSEHITDTTRMTWPQIKEMSDRGHEMSNHGWKHRNFARFPIDTIREDILKNDTAIFRHTGVMPRTFCYPNNNKKAEGRAIAELNRVGTRLKQVSVGSHTSLDSLNRWAQKMIDKKDWGVGMTHGMTYGYDAFGDPTILWKHLDFVKAHEDKIWVGTFHDVASYVKERDSVNIIIKPHKNGLIITPTLDLDRELFTEPLTMIVTTDDVVPAEKISVRQGKKKLTATVKENIIMFDFNPFGEDIRIKIK